MFETGIILIVLAAIITAINVFITRKMIQRGNESAIEQVKINQERINELEVSSNLFSHSLHDLMDKYTDLLNDYSEIDEDVRKQIQAVEEKLNGQHDVNADLIATASSVRDNITTTIEALVIEKNKLIKRVDKVRADLEEIAKVKDSSKKRKLKYKLNLAMKSLHSEIAEYQKREKDILENIIP